MSRPSFEAEDTQPVDVPLALWEEFSLKALTATSDVWGAQCEWEACRCRAQFLGVKAARRWTKLLQRGASYRKS